MSYEGLEYNYIECALDSNIYKNYKIRYLYSTDNPIIYSFALPDLTYIREHEITDIEDLTDRRILYIDVCFN